MDGLKKFVGFLLRVCLWSTLIAAFWTGMGIYWTRDNPDRSMVGLVLWFVLVWLASLPLTLGTEIALLLLRKIREKKAAT